MRRIGDILDEKGHAIHATTPDTPVLEAVDLMCWHRVGALLVREGERPVGIVSERDVLTRLVLARRDAATTPVSDIMTSEVVCVGPDARVGEVMGLMTERRVRHVPVVEAGHLIGMISTGDLVRCASHEHELDLLMLTEYVRGTYPPPPAH